MTLTTWIVEDVAKHFSNWDALSNNENIKGSGPYCTPGTEPLVGIPYDMNTLLLISEGCHNKLVQTWWLKTKDTY